MKAICFCIVCLLCAPLAAFADDEVASCHCYQDQGVNKDGIVPDDLLLTTTQNSIMSVIYQVPKQVVVQNKMLGTGGDDLWVAFELAKQTQRPWNELLLQRRQSDSWHAVLQNQGLGLPKILRDQPEERWGTVIVDSQAIQLFGLGLEDVARLRQQGVGDQEVLLAALLSWKTGRPSGLIYQEALADNSGWGALALVANIPADKIDGLVQTAIQR